MKKMFLITFSIFITFFVIIVANVSASSSVVIDKEKAGGYQYTVLKEQSGYTWKIGHRDSLSTIQENKDNNKDLLRFRTVVKDIKMRIVELSLSASYFLIVIMTALILYKKNKQIPKNFGAIMAILVGIALYFTITNSIDLNRTFQDANFYYSVLTN